MSDTEAVAGVVNWAPVIGGDSCATGILVMDCRGAGNGWSFDSLAFQRRPITTHHVSCGADWTSRAVMVHLPARACGTTRLNGGTEEEGRAY